MKLYINDNNLVLEKNSTTYTSPKQNILIVNSFDRSSSVTYITIRNLTGWSPNKILRIHDLENRDGIPYTENTFEQFKDSLYKHQILDTDAATFYYNIWLEQGNVGTKEEFLEAITIKGDKGKNAFEVWLETNSGGTLEQYNAFIKGADGVMEAPTIGIAFTGVFDFTKYQVSFANYTTAGSITLSAGANPLPLSVNKVLIKGGITINLPSTWSKRGGAFSTDATQWNEIYVQYEAGYITLVNTILDVNFQPIASTTTPIADSTAPTFVTTYPKSTAITASSFSIQVQLNEIGTAYLVVVPNGTAAPTSAQVKAGTASGSILSRSIAVTTANTTATMNATGVSGATNYDVYVVAEDDEATPNLQASPVKVDVLTATSSDTTAPTVPTNLTVASKTDTTVDLTWTASTDAVGVVSYNIFKGGVLEKNVPSNLGQVTGLTAETPYSFTVSALDAAGNQSVQSTALSVTTNAASAVALEAEVSPYMTAIAIPNDSTSYFIGTPQERTGSQITGYVDTLFKELKSAVSNNDLTINFPAIYPNIGKTVARLKFNALNPLDTDAAFRKVYTGGWIHDETGSLANGTDTSANTYINSYTHFGIKQGGMLMSLANNYAGSTHIAGALVGTERFAMIYSVNGVVDWELGYPSFYGNIATKLGIILGYRDNANTFSIHDGILKSSNTTSTSSAFGGVIKEGTAYSSYSTSKYLSTAYIKGALIESQLIAINNAFVNFEVSMGRKN